MIASMFWNLKSDYSGIWGYQNVFNVNYVLPWYIDDLMIILGSYRLYLSMYLPVLPSRWYMWVFQCVGSCPLYVWITRRIIQNLLQGCVWIYIQTRIDRYEAHPMPSLKSPGCFFPYWSFRICLIEEYNLGDKREGNSHYLHTLEFPMIFQNGMYQCKLA